MWCMVTPIQVLSSRLDGKADPPRIVVAYGRDFSDVSPVRGVIVGSGRRRLRVGVDVSLDDGNAG